MRKAFAVVVSLFSALCVNAHASETTRLRFGIDPTYALGRGIAMGLRKGVLALRVTIDGAIASTMKDGTFKKIEQQYFAFDIAP
jgi:ABC-type amino acid transport substrate-binding protein